MHNFFQSGNNPETVYSIRNETEEDLKNRVYVKDHKMTEIFKVTGQDDDRNISSSHFEKNRSCARTQLCNQRR